MLRAEAIRHKHALLHAKEEIPSHLPKTWNHMDRMAKSTEISLFEYKVYRMFRLPMHLCEDHWVANFLLRKAATICEVRESMDMTSVMSAVTGQAAGSPRPSLSFRSMTSAMSTDSVAQNTSGESSAAHALQQSVPLFSVFSVRAPSPATPLQQQQQPMPRLRPHPTSPRQQPSSSPSSHQPLEGMPDPRMPSLHTTFYTDNDNSTSRFQQNTFKDRGVFIPSTCTNSALSLSSSSTTEQHAGRKKKGRYQ
ncbi:hypothetical protein INT45_010268 [Circinella minor]|uniref:Uncharacterized protein n=1 Tax=Circinella minor TaxID=1195481 RepID=A0A8H7RV66_9FUNG|nr:hypothetical protein INT45_010268 [Circinella minor]